MMRARELGSLIYLYRSVGSENTPVLYDVVVVQRNPYLIVP
jgi:hypothetical protein